MCIPQTGSCGGAFFKSLIVFGCLALNTGCTGGDKHSSPIINEIIYADDVMILRDDKKRVGIWNLETSQTSWLNVPPGERLEFFGRAQKRNSSVYLLTKTSGPQATSHLVCYLDTKTLDLGEWLHDGRQDRFHVVGEDFLCGFRVLGTYGSIPRRICEFYRIRENTFEFDHQLDPLNTHSVGRVCAIEPSRVVLFLTPNSEDAGLAKFVFYDVQQRRILEITDTELQGVAALQASRDGKKVVATNTKQLVKIETPHCTSRWVHDLSQHGLLDTIPISVTISDDYRYAVLGSVKLILVDLEEGTSIVLDELNSSLVKSDKSLSDYKLSGGRPDVLAEWGARIELCSAGVVFLPNAHRFVLFMHSGEIQFWDADDRKRLSTSYLSD